MKTRLITLLLFLLAGTVSFATNPVDPAVEKETIHSVDFDDKAATEYAITTKKKGFFHKAKLWVKKGIAKVKNALGGLSDPVDKWFWFWIIGWGAGLLISILSVVLVSGAIFSGGFSFWYILSILGYLAWLFGTVSFIVWLVKKFA